VEIKEEEKMCLSFNAFEAAVRNREVVDRPKYLSLLEGLKELNYREEDIELFYSRNLHNDEETEFIIFLEDGFVIAKGIENACLYDHFNCKVKSKSISISKYSSEACLLSIKFDNGEMLSLNSLADSNSDWNHEYAVALKKLYKKI
jgi:Protein of unknown function (DUF3908)